MPNELDLVIKCYSDMYSTERVRAANYAFALEELLKKLERMPAAALNQNEYQALLSSRADMCEDVGRLQSRVMDLNERLATSVRERDALRTEVGTLQRKLTAETRETNIWRQTATEVAEERETARAELRSLRETTNERIAELKQKLEALTPAPWVRYTGSQKDKNIFPLDRRILYITVHSTSTVHSGTFTVVPCEQYLTYYRILPPEFLIAPSVVP